MNIHSGRKSAKQNVFISYSHTETYLKALAAKALADQGWEVISDDALTTEENPRSKLHKGISKLLNKSLFVMPIITDAWLQSQETRDELIRAHERRKCIVPLVDAELRQEDVMRRLPFFVRELPWISFHKNNIGDLAIKSVSNRNVSIAQRREELLDYLRILGDTITNPECSPREMQVLHAESILGRARREIQRIWVAPSELDFTTSVRHEEAFLSVAAPYFDGAESIDAVSLSRVSKFWITAADDSATRKYRQAHEKKSPLKGSLTPTKVRRLFVFRNADELFAHKTELERHLAVYGRAERCAVFVTSERYYRQVLKSWNDTQGSYSRIHSLEEDFGLLRTGDEAYVARLDGNIYSIGAVQRGTPSEALEHMIGTFLDECEEGQHRAVVRWTKQQSVLISEVGQALFPSEPGPILHMVLIDIDGGRSHHSQDLSTVSNERLQRVELIKEVVDSIAANFKSRQDELGIQEIRILDNPHLPTMTDGLYHGRLKVESRFDFGIVVAFEDAGALQRYYNHQMHSQERRRLYCTLNPEVERLYNEADLTRAQPKDNKRVADIFENIENAMRAWILRIDLHEDLSSSRVANRRRQAVMLNT